MSGQSPRNPYLQWYYQHKTLVWGAAAAAVTVYATYKATCSHGASGKDGPDGRQRQKSQFQRLTSMIKNYSDAASTLAETAAVVSEDLRAFLTSDSSELPQSLRQLNKLLQAPELQETVSTVTASVVRGVTTATQGAMEGPPLVDTIIEAVLSDRGRGLVGMAVGVAMRNATTSVCEFVERRMDAAAAAGGSGGSLGIKDILDMLSSDQGERILTLMLTQSIRTAVTSYVDSTAGYNLYNDMLSSLVKQEHRDALTDLLSRITASFCREAVMSYRRAAAMSAANGATSSGPFPANHASKYTPASSSASANSAVTIVTGRSDAASGPGAPSASASSSSVAVAASCVGGDAGAGAGVGDSGRAAGSLPLVKSNGQLAAGGQNGRPAQGSQPHKQYSACGGANTLGAAGNAAMGTLSRAMLAQAPPPWLRQVVELVRERDVRSLAVDVVSCASREATRGAVEGFLQGSGGSVSGSGANAMLVMPPSMTGYKLYVLATLAVSLCMYALSPRLMML